MTDDKIEIFKQESNVLSILRPDCIEKHKYNQTDLEREITKIVDEVINSDIRLNNTPEVREGLRDYIRIEILFALKIEQAVKHPGSITTADERMIRACAKVKMDLRDETWGQVKGKPGQEREIGLVREQVFKRVIKAGQEVEPLE